VVLIARISLERSEEMRGKIGMVAAMVAVGVFACGASAAMVPGWSYTEIYEMDVSPELATGTATGHTLTHADGTGTNGPSGFAFNAGYGVFLDDSNSSSNQGLLMNDAGSWLGHNGYTADIRIKVLMDTMGNGGEKSMGFAGEPDNGRGLLLDPGGMGYVSNGLLTSNGIDLSSDYVQLRIVVQPDGSQSVYRYLDTAPIITVTAPGGTGINGAVTAGPGFFLGSWAGSSTTQCNFSIDYLRVGLGTDVMRDFTPEPATLALLALGVIPMLRRRR
jgi:hypothetical protein